MAKKKRKTRNSQANDPQAIESILAEISSKLAVLEGSEGEELLSGLDECLELANRAEESAIEEDRPWLGAWIALQKASLHSDLAEYSGAMGRPVQIHAAMNLLLETSDRIPELPPNLNLAAKLYLTLLGILLRMRAFFEGEDQLQALEDLIQAGAENLGQCLAHSHSLKEEAADLLFTSRIIESLDDLAGAPDQGQTSRDLDDQAALLLRLAGGDPAQLGALSGEGQ